MKIAFLPDYYFPHVGGMEVWTHQVARHMSKLGHKVTIFTYKTSARGRDERDEGVTVKRVGPLIIDAPHSYFKRAISLGAGLTRHLLEERFDAYLATYSPLLVCETLNRKPLYSIWHGYYGLEYSLESKGILKGLVRTILEDSALHQGVEGVITVSRYLRNQLLRLNPKLDEERVYVVPGGVDVEFIDSVSFSGKKMQICFLGRMIYEKNPMDALEAFVAVSEDIPELEMVFAGDGPLKPTLEKTVETKYEHVSSRVKFLGGVYGEKKIRLLKESLLLVMPSRVETWPLTPLEALTCKTAFISYDTPAFREIIEETRAGILVNRGDVIGLGEEIVKLILNEKKTKEMAERGRKTITKKFTWLRAAESLNRILIKSS
ncbi:MAG: glycosyltransferase family 4 protein [Candidatus Hydrothermarchaeales archaeon]